LAFRERMIGYNTSDEKGVRDSCTYREGLRKEEHIDGEDEEDNNGSDILRPSPSQIAVSDRSTYQRSCRRTPNDSNRVSTES
jgi:hypothetical protein